MTTPLAGAANVSFPASRAGERARWLAAELTAGAPGISEQTIGRYVHFEGSDDAKNAAAMHRLAEALAGASVTAVDPVNERRLALVFDTPSGRRFRITVEVEEQDPGRITMMWSGRAPREGVTVRRASPDDDTHLREIEFRAQRPGAPTVSVERLSRFWDGEALMEDPAVFVAEADGQPAGVIAMAARDAAVGGHRYRMLYLHRARVLPEHQRAGIGSALVDAALSYAADLGVRTMYWYIAFDNDVARSFAAGTKGWSVGPTFAVIRCAEAAAEPAGRAANPDDAPLVADVLNRYHRDEEMYAPYRPETLAARVERAPDLYGWSDLRVGRGAVVGVRHDGAQTRVWSERGEERWMTTRAAVLDYGCLPGAEAELERLIRGWCRELLDQGVDELSLLTSPGSRAGAMLQGLAREVVQYEMWTSGVAEPQGGAQHGVYADHVYF